MLIPDRLQSVLAVGCVWLLSVEGGALAQTVPEGKAGKIKVVQLQPAPDTDVHLTEAFLTRANNGERRPEHRCEAAGQHSVYFPVGIDVEGRLKRHQGRDAPVRVA